MSHRFYRLPDTDVWYRTYRFRNDARFMYMLSINDPLTSWDVQGQDRRKRYAGVRPDPLNQRNGSYVSLPRAPSERWSEDSPGIAHGEIHPYSFRSEALFDERKIEVYETPGFRPGEDIITPILILFDGAESKDLLKAPVILDHLFAEQRIRPMLAVFLIQPYEQREKDLECNESTNIYLVNELLPWLRIRYGIRTDAAHTIVAGSSLGGLAAAFAGIRHPDTIGRVLSQSGSFWWGREGSTPQWLTSEFLSARRVDVQFYLDVGLMETKGGKISQLKTNRRLRTVLRSKGYRVLYREFNGPHAFPCWRAGFGDALLALLSD
jgi:enterochelin esterase-like enzyme